MQPSDIIFLSLLVLTNAFWAIQTHRLINKLMSRNYYEYEQSHLKEEKKTKTIEVPADESEDFGALAEIIDR